MPFRLSELAQMSLTLRDVCLGIIDLTHPDTRPVTHSTRVSATQQLGVLAYVFRVCIFPVIVLRPLQPRLIGKVCMKLEGIDR